MKSCSVVSDSLRPPWTTVHGILQARIQEWVAFPFSRGSSQPRDRTQVFCIAGRFFTTSTPWEDRNPSKSESLSVMPGPLRPHGLYSPWNSPDQNTGVGSLSLLQGIFPTQGSNRGLLHCRWILYQLSYQGKPSGPPLILLLRIECVPGIVPCGPGHCLWGFIS